MSFEIEYKIKPLSINKAFQGRRFKTPEYLNYEKELLLALPKKKMPEPPYLVCFEFGFSNKASDIDNPVKCLTDIMQKKYLFDDKEIYEMRIKKVIVKKGGEFFKIEIKTIDN